MAGSSGEGRSEEIVVDKVVAAESDEIEGFVNELLSLFFSDQQTQSLLVLLKELELSPYPYDVKL